MPPRLHTDPAGLLRDARTALAHGDLSRAEAVLNALVSTGPGNARAWTLLAETALLRNRSDAGIVCAERAIARAPRDPLAHVMLAKSRLAAGEPAAALAEAVAADSLLADDPAVLDALAALFGLLGRHERALALCRRAVAAHGGNAQYLFNLAATERMLGLLEDAEVHCEDALALEPGYGPAHYVRADLRTQDTQRNHVGQMTALLQAGNLAWSHEVLVHYALVKECEDLEQHAQAFAHAQVGARLWRSQNRYDAGTALAGIERLIAAPPPRTAAGGGTPGDPVFVCGLPRTGTTLVERIVAGHPAMDSVGECGVFAAEARRSAAADPLGARYLATVRAIHALRAERFVDKTLVNYLHVGAIHAALPQARVILVERDAMDCAWALYKAHFQAGFLYSYDLTELADYYLAYRRLVAHWQRVVPGSALLTVRYEELVRAPRQETERILAFLGLPWHEAPLRFHASPAPSATASAVQVRRPLYVSSVGRWRPHAAALAPFRERLAQVARDFVPA